jgi:hypothetical protein
MSEQEIPLHGGNVTGAVRVGETVRRATGAWSGAIHALLRHLEARGFDAAPRFLGLDEQGREMLTFFAGEVGHYPLPPYMWTEEAMQAVARLVRHYHEAQRDFVPPSDACWQMVYPDVSRHEVICHNDIAPYNMVYVGGQPYGLIDFDCAGPGPRSWDLAYAAYRFVPLAHLDDPTIVEQGLTNPHMQGERFQLFCDAYGIAAHEVLELVKPRLQTLCVLMIEQAHAGNAAFQRMIAEGHLAHYQRELQTLQSYLPIIEQHQPPHS